MEYLKNRPFCGGEAHIEAITDEYYGAELLGYRVECSVCGAHSATIDAGDTYESKAIAAVKAAARWNNREL